MLLSNFDNLNSISNIFQETRDSFDGPSIIRIYLRTAEKDFLDQGKVRHPSSKLIKYDLVQALNIFRNPFLLIFAAAKGSLVSQFVLILFFVQ